MSLMTMVFVMSVVTVVTVVFAMSVVSGLPCLW